MRAFWTYGNMRTYATIKELKKKGFTLKDKSMKEAIGIQVTFMLEIKVQKYIFNKIWPFFQPLLCFLNLYEDENVHTYATAKELKKKAFTVKIHNIKEAINIQLTLISENKHQIKIRPFFSNNASILKLC